MKISGLCHQVQPTPRTIHEWLCFIRQVLGVTAVVALPLNRVILNLCGAEGAFGP